MKIAVTKRPHLEAQQEKNLLFKSFVREGGRKEGGGC